MAQHCNHILSLDCSGPDDSPLNASVACDWLCAQETGLRRSYSEAKANAMLTTAKSHLNLIFDCGNEKKK